MSKTIGAGVWVADTLVMALVIILAPPPLSLLLVILFLNQQQSKTTILKIEKLKIKKASRIFS